MSVRITRHRQGKTTRRKDVVAVEEPMEIRLNWGTGERQTRSVAVTMRTPGHDFELAAGFLFSEGILHGPRGLAELAYCTGDEPQEYNIIEARLRPGVEVDESLFTRNFYTTSSCGVCGKASLEAVEVQGCEPLAPGTLRLLPERLSLLPERLLEAQRVFERTGGLHAAGLFNEAGDLQIAREDVGRHNAVDKVVGEAFLDGRLPLDDSVLVVSGRSSFEIIQKALMAGIPAVVAVGAPSSLAVELAKRFNMTLVGFARNAGCNVYSGLERLA